MTQHVDEEGFLPSSQDTGGAGEHGKNCTLLHHGFQESLEYTVYHVHGWQPLVSMSLRGCPLDCAMHP